MSNVNIIVIGRGRGGGGRGRGGAGGGFKGGKQVIIEPHRYVLIKLLNCYFGVKRNFIFIK